MSAVMWFLNALSVPLMVLNIFGEVVSGIWLLIIGDWRVVLLGIGIVIVSSFGLSILMLPSLLFAGLAALGKRVSQIIAVVLSMLYTGAIIVIWCSVVLFLFGRQVSPKNLVPVMIWSYGVAVGPWAYMASHEDNPHSMLSTFFAELGYAVVLLMVFFGSPSFLDLVLVLAGFMLVAQVINWVLFAILSREEKRSKMRGVEGDEEEA
jgi:hypothetical protein